MNTFLWSKGKEGKRRHHRSKRNWEDINKTELKAIEREDADRINLSIVRDQWQTIVSTVKSIPIL
jgi:hypothetical protein